jgi:hypothetical protein
MLLLYSLLESLSYEGTTRKMVNAGISGKIAGKRGKRRRVY